jgi:hypothetical protein
MEYEGDGADEREQPEARADATRQAGSYGYVFRHAAAALVSG